VVHLSHTWHAHVLLPTGARSACGTSWHLLLGLLLLLLLL
jgi:hypothetical protein